MVGTVRSGKKLCSDYVQRIDIIGAELCHFEHNICNKRPMPREEINETISQATALLCLLPSPSLAFVRCRGSSKLKNLWGDALTDPVSCLGERIVL